jgi:hypothetical protein
MGRIDDRLGELGLTLPAPMAPSGNFELVTVRAGTAYVAGHAPIDGSMVLVQGTVGRDLTLDDGYRATRLTGLSILASLKHALGDLDRVTRWLRAGNYARCSLASARGSRHARVRAVGTSSPSMTLLPSDAQRQPLAPVQEGSAPVHTTSPGRSR